MGRRKTLQTSPQSSVGSRFTRSQVAPPDTTVKEVGKRKTLQTSLQSSVSTRFTRSQVAPDQAVKEMAQSKKFQTSLQSSVGSRCTRSQVAPDWTVKEMLVLVNEVATLNKDTLKSLPSCQKWRMISENCATVEVVRSSNQCRRQWEQILAEYKKIREWEIQHGPGSYWCLESERKFEFELPSFFDRELFGEIAKFLHGQEPQSDSEVESETEGLISPIEDGMLNLFALHGLQKKRGRGRPRKHSTEQILAAKLVEDAQLVQTILRGDPARNGTMDIEQACDSQAKFAINQGDELIKVFGTLVGKLDQLVDCVKQRV